jgi:UDP-glucose 4-epimerase
MAMYYQNLVKILCSLIEDSLVRALDYLDKISDEIYLDGSKVIEKERFKQMVKVHEQMEQASIAEYSMLKFDANPETIVPISNELKEFFRDTDVFGQGEDDNLYVMLSGTGANSIQNVLERLEEKGIYSHSMS